MSKMYLFHGKTNLLDKELEHVLNHVPDTQNGGKMSLCAVVPLFPVSLLEN